ncbi:hypothetical protein SAMN05518672_11243 [Chitinophaga sp. CF118]|uniref:hypothetical protein n=1 Tax=Chitinophaga sp. CF118 TaxID=1884367 RepID=UPI0008ECCD91|nr:hypothetical protein [Chitinophaga sp. CF118]SFE91684.1 hypothetical protein SAMN05518672_11243 [Chitinophaga sp. CF118]
MKDESTVKPTDKLSGIATGMLMMALFTGIWTVIAYIGLKTSPYKIALILFPVLISIFTSYALRFLKVSKHYPDQGIKVVSEADKKRDKRFTYVFVGEGLGILIGINIVTNLGYPDLVIPVIALVVGLHFFPLGWLFKRAQDYYLATWSTVVAVCGIIFSFYGLLSYSWVIAFIGVGMAVATSVYGCSMLIRGLKMRVLADALN